MGTPKNPWKFEEIYTPQYMGEITPKNEGFVGFPRSRGQLLHHLPVQLQRYLYPVRHTFIDDPAGRLDSLEGFLHERQVRDAKHKKVVEKWWGGSYFCGEDAYFVMIVIVSLVLSIILYTYIYIYILILTPGTQMTAVLFGNDLILKGETAPK